MYKQKFAYFIAAHPNVYCIFWSPHLSQPLLLCLTTPHCLHSPLHQCAPKTGKSPLHIHKVTEKENKHHVKKWKVKLCFQYYEIYILFRASLAGSGLVPKDNCHVGLTLLLTLWHHDVWFIIWTCDIRTPQGTVCYPVKADQNWSSLITTVTINSNQKSSLFGMLLFDCQSPHPLFYYSVPLWSSGYRFEDLTSKTPSIKQNHLRSRKKSLSSSSWLFQS